MLADKTKVQSMLLNTSLLVCELEIKPIRRSFTLSCMQKIESEEERRSEVIDTERDEKIDDK